MLDSRQEIISYLKSMIIVKPKIKKSKNKKKSKKGWKKKPKQKDIITLKSKRGI